MQWRIGTMTFSNPGWQGTFYPEGLPKTRWLPYYASQFNCIELNNTFHAIPTVATVKKWRDHVAKPFQFALKTPRLITHDAPLEEAPGIMGQFLEAVRAMEYRLGPILIQFPPDLPFTRLPLVEAFLRSLPEDLRFAVEFRQPEWFGYETVRLLKDLNLCLVATDLEGHPEARTLVPTADFLYVRLLGKHGRFPDETHERFDPTAFLKDWHERIEREAVSSLRECWVLFNNDFAGHAPATARRFASLAGLAMTPEPERQRKLFDL